jgi:hypothetical protein
MPMKRDRYPPNWGDIANRIKTDADWTCQQCGRPCREPGEPIDEFAVRLAESNHEWLTQLDDGDGQDHYQRFILTVAHLDQNPRNNEPENLKALCSVCHLNHDRPFRRYNAYRKREYHGQLSLEQL